MKSFATYLLLWSSLCLWPSPAFADSARAIELAENMLMDVSIRSDLDGILLARERFGPFVEHESLGARAHYAIGLANLQLLLSGYQPDGRAEVIESALSHLEKATTLKGEFAEAYAVSAMCYAFQSQLDSNEAAKCFGAAQKSAARAQELAKDDPIVMFVQGMFSMYNPATLKQAVAHFEKAMQSFDRRREGKVPDWWHVMACAWAGGAHLWGSDPDLEKAQQFLRRALELRPDFVMAENLLEQTVPLSMAPSSSLPTGKWTPLLDDGSGDGKLPGGVDGKSLSYLFDAGRDYLWLKYTLHGELDTKSFGVNFVVDADGDPETGFAWWGSNKTFKFDRLVTVWVTQLESDRYRGIVGICDAEGAAGMRMTNIGKHNVAFSALPEEASVVIGLDRSSLGKSDLVHCIGAVGNHQAWNDDIGDQGHAVLRLPATGGPGSR